MRQTLLLLILVAGCGGVDVARDASPPVDAGTIDATPTRTNIVPTAGGGSAASPGFRAHVRIGTPQPVGNASSPGYRVRLGPLDK